MLAAMYSTAAIASQRRGAADAGRRHNQMAKMTRARMAPRAEKSPWMIAFIREGSHDRPFRTSGGPGAAIEMSEGLRGCRGVSHGAAGSDGARRRGRPRTAPR